ncbi:MAG: hypothetical protein H6850_03000 [Alphaproteobacteria bacterium]|nr:MAG: hypothetical protein H6850_03000 [Alphaproteobacteria bacterium]
MFFFLQADEYISIKGGYSRTKREFSDDFKDKGIQKDNVQTNIVGSAHVGYIRIAKHLFWGVEIFGGKLFSGDTAYFEQDFSLGLKAYLGAQLNNRWKVYAGGGVFWAEVRSLKAKQDEEVLTFYQKPGEDVAPEQKLESSWNMKSPSPVGTFGILYTVDTSWSFNAEVNYLFNNTRKFKEGTILSSKNIIGTTSSLKHNFETDNQSEENFNNVQVVFGLTYFGGFL